MESYNNGKYIGRCVESVLSQSYSFLEVLVVDDGSTDNTLSLMNDYKKDSRFKLISKENGGLSSVRQRGLDEAKGDYICFIDADDYLAHSYLEKHVDNLLRTNADISVCSTRFELASGDYLPIESKGFACDNSNDALKLKSDKLNNGTFPYNISLSDSWNKMYRMSFLRLTGVRFLLPKGLNGTDTAFNWKLALFEPTYSTIKEEEYIHVIYKSSAAHRKHKNLYTSFESITDQLIETTNEKNQFDLYKPAISSFYYGGLRMALTDVARESKNIIECRNVINTILKKQREYVANKGLTLNRNKKNDLDYKIILLLFDKTPRLLFVYLFLRTRLAKMIKHTR